MKVVIDTNVLISYALGNLAALKIFDFDEKSLLKFYADKRLLHEYLIILSKPKFKLSNAAIEKLQKWIEKYIIIIEATEKVTFNPDRQDSKILEIANFVKADYIVTDDKPLLRNSGHLTTAKIVSLNSFSDILRRLI